MHIIYDLESIDAGFDAIHYSQALNYSSKQAQGVQGEKALWCAVIHQAFLDMLPLCVPGKRAVNNRRSLNAPVAAAPASKVSEAALNWLLYNQKDFNYVCGQAGVLPDVIRRAALILARRYALV